MKKILTLFLCFSITATAVVSCKKDKNGDDCTSSGKKLSDAALAYGTNPSSDNCKAFKAAWDAYMGGQCTGSLPSEQQSSYQEMLNNLNCQ